MDRARTGWTAELERLTALFTKFSLVVISMLAGRTDHDVPPVAHGPIHYRPNG